MARSLGVPMVTGCRLPAQDTADLSGSSWLAAIDGTAGEVALLPPSRGAPPHPTGGAPSKTAKVSGTQSG